MIIKLVPNKPKESLPLYDDIRKRKPAETEKHQYYIEPQIPGLPEWTNKTYHCQDEEVNLFKLTCTCEDFKARKENYTDRDVRLCCKHIYYKLSNTAAKRYINSLYKNLSYAAAFFDIDSFFTFNIDKRDIYYGFNGYLNWVQVFVPVTENDADSYARFSYSPKLHRWSRGIEPENEWKIVYILERIIKNKN
jgi:hypothetical protein